MSDVGMDRLRYVGYIALSLFVFMILIVGSSSGTNPSPDPLPDSQPNYVGDMDIWHFDDGSFRRAWLNIENPYQEPKLVTGIQMTFNLTDERFKAKVAVQRGFLGEDQQARTEHQITGFHIGKEKTQQFLFTEDEYLTVDTDYNLQLKALTKHHLVLQLMEGEEGETNSRFWDPDTEDWDTESPEDPDSSIKGKEWAMRAMIEPVVRLTKEISSQSTFQPPDAVDAFFADLTKDKTYVFTLEHDENNDFEASIYRYRDSMNIPGMINEDTLIDTTTGEGGTKIVTVTPQYTGRYYIVVSPKIGSGPYSIRYEENDDPVAIASEDLSANLRLGGSTDVRFYNEGSYDPDDDENGNGEIDRDEENKLKYYWDIDANEDSDGDGDYTNDKDVTGNGGTYQFTEGGEFTVTLTVEDQYGASASVSQNLFVNYIPVVKAKAILPEDSELAFAGKKIRFSAEGSYDPDDDTNENGRIDGTETDHLTYCWDFFHKIDKNMDGNYTNDTDINNMEWRMAYEDPGEYVITLNVIDETGKGVMAYNHTQLEIEVLKNFEPMEYFPESALNEEGWYEIEEKVVDDVGFKEQLGSEEAEFKVGTDPSINIQRIYCKVEGDQFKIGLITQSEIVTTEPESGQEEVTYSLYLVRRPYAEPKITENNFGRTFIDNLYNFTYVFGNKLITTPEEGGASSLTVTVKLVEDNFGLEFSVPTYELVPLEDELEEDEQLDIFAVTSHTVLTTKQAQTYRIYTKDSAGENPSLYPDDWYPANGDDDDDDGNGNNGNVKKDYTVQIIAISVGGAFFLVIVIVIILVLKKRKKGEGYREYTIAKAGSGPPSGFSVGGGPSGGGGGGPPGPPGAAPPGRGGPGGGPMGQQAQRPPQQPQQGQYPQQQRQAAPHQQFGESGQHPGQQGQYQQQYRQY